MGAFSSKPRSIAGESPHVTTKRVFFQASSSPRSSLRQTKSGKLGQNKELYHKGPAKHPGGAAVQQNARNMGDKHGEHITTAV